MCELASLGALIGLSGGATAAGATAGAAAAASAGAIGSGLASLGTIVSIGGAIAQGIGGARAAKQNAALIESQKQTEAQLNAVQDQRERLKLASAIGQQNAELAARGVSLDSPTAIYLGQHAAAEMAFNSQAIRNTGQATQTELTGQQRAFQARGKMSLLRGGLSAAGTVLNRAPDIWPGLAG